MTVSKRLWINLGKPEEGVGFEIKNYDKDPGRLHIRFCGPTAGMYTDKEDVTEIRDFLTDWLDGARIP